MKKILSILLVILTILSTCAVAVAVQPETQAEDYLYYEGDYYPFQYIIENNEVKVINETNNAELSKFQGLARQLINNMVVGVSEGYSKELEINGIGYRAAKQGKDLVLNIGYSHQVIMPEIDGITIDVPAPNKIIISGPDKQKVGQFAAEVRGKRPPEPYKGKGIKYIDEVIRRKEGKAGKGK